MIPSRNFDNFPTFASAGTRVSPDNAKYAAGFVPDDTYPAFWANYFLHGATKGISDLNPVVKSLIDECNYVVTQSGQTLDATDNTQLYTAVRSFTKDRITIDSDTILTVNSDIVARITANSVITITLADSVIVGASLRVYNTTAYNQNLKARTPDGNNTTVTLLAGSQNTIEWDGGKWISGNAPAVGATFVQYPNEQLPEIVYPCSKWEKLDFGGAFFRSSGGNAQAFSNQTSVQAQGTAKNGLSVSKSGTVTGESQTIYTGGAINLTSTAAVEMNHRHGCSGSEESSAGGTYFDNSTHSKDSLYTNYANLRHRHSATFTPSITDSISVSLSSTDTETRPINYTIQIWKRTA